MKYSYQKALDIASTALIDDDDWCGAENEVWEYLLESDYPCTCTGERDDQARAIVSAVRDIISEVVQDA